MVEATQTGTVGVVIGSKNKRVVIFTWLVFGILAGLSLFSLAYSYLNVPDESLLNSILSGDLLWGLLPIEYAFMAAMILARQPRNSIGWLLMLPAVAMANDASFQTYFNSFVSAPLHPSLSFIIGSWIYSASWLLLIFPIFFIMQFFPTGRPLSPRWRWITFYVLGVCACFLFLIVFLQKIEPQNVKYSIPNPVGFIPNAWFDQFLWILWAFGLLSTTVASMISIFMRYRSALAVEREQIKWLLYAASLFAVIYLITLLFNLNSHLWQGAPAFFNFLVPLALMTIPAAIAIAILRYRLWDIDLIIRKTLVYGLLTAALALVFFGGVTLLQSLFQVISGEKSAISIVLSTLVIAGLFNPLRRKVQNFIDRRFYRKKYDAEQALARFSVQARSETNLDQLCNDLAEVIEETMQPEMISLWLKPHEPK